MFKGNSLRPAEDVEKPARKVFAEKPQVPEDPSDIRATYYVKERWGKRYHYADYQQKQLAITATPDAIRTKRDDRETVSAMLSLAEARGWDSVHASGTKDFRREVWIQGQVKGIAVSGYKATETDRQEVAKRLGQTPEPSKQAEAVSKSAGEQSVDNEIRKAKHRQREREAAIWDRVEQIGRAAIAIERRQAQKQAPVQSSRADEGQQRVKAGITP